MARRTHQRTIKQLRVTLASAESAVRGQTAYGNPADGTAVADPDGTTGLIPLGYFTEDLEGDGTQTTLVDLFEELQAEGYTNDDAPNAIDASDVFTNVYAKDGATVSTLSTNRSVAGRVLFIDPDDGRVYVRAPRV